MARVPMALRKVPLITKWSPEILAQLLIDRFEGDTYLLTAYEWVENQAARLVSPSTMREALRGLNTEASEHSKIARFPAHYFVWSDKLEAAYETYHSYVSLREELDIHDAFDIDPATHPFNDLLQECPDFSSNPCLSGGAPLSRRDLRRQRTTARYANWQARADALHRDNPDQSKSWIADRISREPIAEECDAETIRRNIRIR